MTDLTKHVTSLDWSRKLKELGVPQESLHYWSRPTEMAKYEVDDITQSQVAKDVIDDTGIGNYYSAFLSTELGEWLPERCYTRHQTYWVCIDPGLHHRVHADTETNARAALLAHLIEQGIIDAKKL